MRFKKNSSHYIYKIQDGDRTFKMTVSKYFVDLFIVNFYYFYFIYLLLNYIAIIAKKFINI